MNQNYNRLKTAIQTGCCCILFSACNLQAEKTSLRPIGNHQNQDSIIVISQHIEESFYRTNNCVTINIPSNIEQAKEKDIVEEYDFIRLETLDKCLISKINKIIFIDDSFFIFDEDGNTAFRFSKAGKFLNCFGNKGRGPGEYTRITDLAVNNQKEVCLLDSYGYKLLYYNYDGELIREEPMYYQFNKIEFSGNKKILCTELGGNSQVKGLKYHNILITNDRQKKKKKGFRYEVNNEYSFVTKTPLLKYMDKIYSQHMLCDTIWSINGTDWDAAYVIKSNHIKYPDRKEIIKWNDNDVIEFTQKSKGSYTHNFVETKKHICFSINDNGMEIPLIYNKENGHVYCRNIVLGENCDNMGNNLICGSFDFALNDNCFLNVISPYSVLKQKEYFYNKGITMSAKDRILAESITEEDNPILMVFAIKDF